jgi:hypothetical protein
MTISSYNKKTAVEITACNRRKQGLQQRLSSNTRYLTFNRRDNKIILAFWMPITANKIAFAIPTNFESQGSFRTTADIQQAMLSIKEETWLMHSMIR